MRIHDLQLWEAFYGVAKKGSFSKAAKNLGIPIPQVSKRVSRLEDQLGARLFQRSTRNVSLTNEGKSLLPKISTLLEDFREIEDMFDKKPTLSGMIKITSVPYVAHKLLIPILKKFKKLYPKIDFEINLSKDFINIIEHEYDMALRIETPKDSELIYKKILPNELIFCATPKYLKAHGLPKKPEELKKHNMLILDVHKNCEFILGEKKLKTYLSKQKYKSDNANFLKDMCLSDLGILVRARWDIQEELKKGKLVEILKKHKLKTFGNIHAVISSRRYLAPRVRVFLDFFEKELQNIQ